MKPDVFVIGATKCATSTLHYQLSQNDFIDVSTPKEPRLLERGLSQKTIESEYEKVFKGEGVKIDCNPNNMVIGYVPERMKLLNPKAKVILMVREPVSRFVSHYNYFRNMRPGREPLSIDEVISAGCDLDKFTNEADYVPYICEEWGNYKHMYLESGCYNHYLNKYKDLFDIMIIPFEHYIKDEQAYMDKICDWICAPKFKLRDKRIRNADKGGVDLTDEQRDFLVNFYKPHNKALFDSVGEIEEWTY